MNVYDYVVVETDPDTSRKRIIGSGQVLAKDENQARVKGALDSIEIDETADSLLDNIEVVVRPF